MKTQFVTNEKGKKVAAVVPIREYNKMLKDLEELEDITLYDQAKKNDPEGLPIDEAFSIIEAERKKEVNNNKYFTQKPQFPHLIR